MIHFLVSHWKIAMPIAVATLNIIALIAILVARSELRKAAREIDKLSASLDSRRAASFAAIKERANL